MNWTEHLNINTTQTEYFIGNHSSDNYYYHEDPILVGNIALALLPSFIILGIPINLIAFCIWMFGPKSKTLCCATYFAFNAVADFLCCTIPGISVYTAWFCLIKDPHWDANIPAGIVGYTVQILLALSNWISASITIERAFTILLPFTFHPQDMRKRSKYVVLGIFVMLVSTFVPSVYFRSEENSKVVSLFDLGVRIVLPFTLIVTMNTAVVATLCQRKFQHNTLSTNRTSYVEVFTKITLLSGLAFMLSNAIGVMEFMIKVFGIQMLRSYILIHVLALIMYFFNCLSNPIICLIVCKSVREDLWSFVCMIAQQCRNTCQCRRPNQVPDPVHV